MRIFNGKIKCHSMYIKKTYLSAQHSIQVYLQTTATINIHPHIEIKVNIAAMHLVCTRNGTQPFSNRVYST